MKRNSLKYAVFGSAFLVCALLIVMNPVVAAQKVAVPSTNFLSKGVTPNTSISVLVNGMVCSFCAQGISKAFKKHEAIRDVTVSLEHKRVDLELNPPLTISDELIRSMIRDAGYNVKEIHHQ